ncbi:MAG: ABC transporter [Micavibrio sp.]|nr:ABC transporter [Micavibrio sp.]|tara:strand:- start:531 stop:2324 length:1794 start_codon:yes stop_codon:yes gene_type:complete
MTITGLETQNADMDLSQRQAEPLHGREKHKHASSKNDTLKPQGFRQSVYSLLLSTLAINILSLALPIMTLQVYDRILPNPGTGTLPVLISGVCLAIFLEACLRLCRAYVIGRSGAAYEHRMACNAIDKILGADPAKMGSYGIGEYLHRMGSVGKLKDFYNGYALTVIAELLFVPVYLGLILYIAYSLTIVPAVILTLFIIVSLWKGQRLRLALKKREQADDKRFNFLIESLEGVHTLKAFALEKFFERRYEQMEEQSCLENYNVTQETARTFNIGAIFSHIMVASVITAGAWFVLQGQLSTGALIATLLLSGRMMQPVQKALALWTRYQDYSLARDHLEELFATPQQNIASRESVIPRISDGRLAIYDLSFRYKDKDDPIIKNVSLKMKRGESILISGGHGAGKTSLLSLIAGTYPPTKGEIHIDGENINTYAPEELVRHVGFIRTQALIFRGTIRDNITCFGQINEAQAREVSALLNVDKDVAQLPGGFDTFLTGNNTDSVSPGLKQRIAIVRVLATKPRLILFDNADRSLDKEGYAMIYSLLARLKGKASMILISDDRNIRSLASKHYIMQDGELIPSEDVFSKGNIHPYKELRL